VPLLSRNRRSSVIFIGTAALFFLPFLLWDPRGFVNNLAFPFTLQQLDSTAPLFFLPSVAGSVIRLSVVAVFASWIGTLYLRRWPERETLFLLALLHLAVLGSGSIFHNNYVIWAMSVVALFWVCVPDEALKIAADRESGMLNQRAASDRAAALQQRRRAQASACALIALVSTRSASRGCTRARHSRPQSTTSTRPGW
jgi:hypothetical protein